jgi:hypothetical protein
MKPRRPIPRVSKAAPHRGGKTGDEPGVKVMPDGREICNQYTDTGRKAYRKRTEEGRQRQGGRCCLEGYCPGCPGYLSAEYATLEHENGRGMGGGHRDDRMVINGRWHNGAAHFMCNNWKGSRRIDYNTAIQARAGLKPVVPERKA